MVDLRMMARHDGQQMRSGANTDLCLFEEEMVGNILGLKRLRVDN